MEHVIESGWIKTRIIMTNGDIDNAKILRDSGVPNDTHVIATIPYNSFPSNVALDYNVLLQGCVSSVSLITVEMVRSCDLPTPPSPLLESSTGSLSLANEVSLYLPETISRQFNFKHRDLIWIQPMESHPIEEVWLSPFYDYAGHLIETFMRQLEERIVKSKIIVKMNETLQFTVNSSHDPVGAYKEFIPKELKFDVLKVLPIVQGHLTKHTRIIGLPAGDKSHCHDDDDDDDDETDSDEGLSYDTKEGTVGQCSDSDLTDDDDDILESHDLPSLPRQRQQQLMSASHIRRSSSVTRGKVSFKCIPLYDFPAEKNFVLLPEDVRRKLGCFGLENLFIYPVEELYHHGYKGVSFVAIVEQFKGRHNSHSTVYVHPEVYFNLFPFPVDHVTTIHRIHAEVSSDLLLLYVSMATTGVSSRTY